MQIRGRMDGTFIWRTFIVSPRVWKVLSAGRCGGRQARKGLTQRSCLTIVLVALS